MLLWTSSMVIVAKTQEQQQILEQILSMKKFDLEKILELIQDLYTRDDFHKFLIIIVKQLLTLEYMEDQAEKLYQLLNQIVPLLGNNPKLLIKLCRILITFLKKRGSQLLSFSLKDCIGNILNILSSTNNNRRITSELRREFELFNEQVKFSTLMKDLRSENFMLIIRQLIKLILNNDIHIEVRLYFFSILQKFFRQLEINQHLASFFTTIKLYLDQDLAEHERKLANSF
jgi:hypothetical protein